MASSVLLGSYLLAFFGISLLIVRVTLDRRLINVPVAAICLRAAV